MTVRYCLHNKVAKLKNGCEHSRTVFADMIQTQRVGAKKSEGGRQGCMGPFRWWVVVGKFGGELNLGAGSRSDV